MRHVGEFFAHHLLGFDRICRYTRNRSLVADRTRQHDIDVVTDAGVHDATGQDLFLNSAGDSSRLANCIDRSDQVLTSSAREGQIGIHSQRSAEQCAFHVISGKRISGKEPIDITRFDEAHQMLTGAGSDDRRADDHGNFSFRCMRTIQFAGQLANDGRFRFVGIDDCVDELKNIRARGCALHRYNAHTLVTDHDLVAFANVEELNSSGGTSFSIDRYSAVHHGWLHFDFLAVDADERLLIRRHVEIGRENSVGRGGSDLRICALQNFGALLAKT